jgi:thiaminase/transcriptional activator TenA
LLTQKILSHPVISSSAKTLLEHSFPRALANGTLPKKIWHDFLKKDLVYLSGYSKAMSCIANRLSDEKHTDSLKKIFTRTQALERQIELRYLANSLAPLTFFTPVLHIDSPAVQRYTAYLSAMTQHESLIIGLTSLWPCLWVYNQLGTQMIMKVDNAHPYKDWIQFLFNPLSQSTQAVSQIINDMEDTVSIGSYQEMVSTFLKCLQFEHDFFDEIHQPPRKEKVACYRRCKF